MKIVGKRILNSSLRFVFEVDGDILSAADERHIARLNEAVTAKNGDSTTLSNIVHLVSPLVNSEGEVKVGIEPIYDEDGA